MAHPTAQVLIAGMMLAASYDGLWANTPAPPACLAREALPTQIRPYDCGTAEIVRDGLARSATFRQLVARVGQLRGIVYIEDRYFVHRQTRRVLRGACTYRITTAGAYRVLHLMVAPESGDRRLLTLAHELQHAVEVLEASDVTTEVAVARLFERIGTRVGPGIMETQAAHEAERAVRRELNDRR